MVSRYLDKNRFGAYTWQIKLDSLFHLYIEETNTNSFVVNFKEFKWISFKTHWSLVSNDDLFHTVEIAFNKVHETLKYNKDYAWTSQQWDKKRLEVIELMKRTRE